MNDKEFDKLNFNELCHHTMELISRNIELEKENMAPRSELLRLTAHVAVLSEQVSYFTEQPLCRFVDRRWE